jgi:DnaJ-class molecular chaperone
MDPFEILGVTPDSTEEEIKKAYKKLSLKLHPDRNKAPDANERFQECVKAYEQVNSLKDPELRAAYKRGGWEFVEMLKQNRDARATRLRACPPFGIKVPVTLRSLFKGDKVDLNAEIPILNDNGVKCGTKTFKLELPLNPEQLERRQVVQHQGIERPDHINGDIVIEVEIDWAKEPTKFDINNGDIIYNYTLNATKMFGVFDFSFLHPNGKTYRVYDSYRFPDKNGEQVYIVPGEGLTSNDNLTVFVSPDFNSFAQVKSSPRLKNELIESLSLKTNEKPKFKEGETDLVSVALTLDQYKQKMAKERPRFGIPGIHMEGGPTECRTQ